MIIGVLKEPDFENRVAIIPENVSAILKLNVKEILIQQSAGESAFFSDEDFKEKGATIASVEDVLSKSNVLLSIHPPSNEILSNLSKNQVLIGQFNPLSNKDLVSKLLELGLTSFSLDAIPRTTRAQAMDVLSSMATAAGYQAVLKAAVKLPQFFPMFMTAAGTIKPAKVLILGAGVAGLQAISVARKLGAVVEAFDVRLAAKEEVLSLGARFVEVEGATDDKGAGGYAVEQTEEYKQKQAALIQQHAKGADVIICTAQIPGRKAPLLVTQDTLENMKKGSVVVDLAASTGGNCAMTENNKTINHHGITIIGDSNLASSIPSDASKMFGKNMTNFLALIVKEGELNLNFEDDLVEGTCISHEGAVKNERVKKAMG
ncbi:MAG: NAD(P) transhydrogenase subunit alpha [Saprospiraceae bacterium]